MANEFKANAVIEKTQGVLNRTHISFKDTKLKDGYIVLSFYDKTKFPFVQHDAVEVVIRKRVE